MRACSVAKQASLAWALAVSLGAGCTCGATPGAAGEIAGCSDETPMLTEPVTIGAATLTPDDRRLVISGLPAESRWVVGRGPALSVEPFAPALDAVEALEPHGVLILGSLGRGERLAELVEALGSLAVPVLVVPGPRDRPGELLEALEAHPAPNVVSLAGVHVVEVGPVELAIASGGASPRYVLDGACGISRADLDAILGSTREDHVRVLVGFDAPAGTPLTVGLEGTEAGSEVVGVASTEAGVTAGLFAGPDTRVGEPFDGAAPGRGPSRSLRLIVAPLAGPAVESTDGSRRSAGPTAVLLGPDGLRALP